MLKPKILALMTLVLVLLLVLAACGDSQEWYEGGTLHQATAADWKVADEPDRLATSADYASEVLFDKENIPDSMDELREYAQDMKTCIDEAVLPDPVLPDQKVAEIGAACAVLMNW